MVPVDLNLLAVFDTLYDLRSVTRAAQRLNLTQSAVSHALRRLRDAIGDPLFVRAGNALQPTARAREIAPGVREGLARLRTAVVPLAFEPACAVRTFTLAAGSYFCTLLIPRLVARAREVAPGLTFRIVPIGTNLLAELDEGLVDLALGAFDRLPARLDGQTLFREDLVWIAAAANPIAGSLTGDQLLCHAHLVIATRQSFEPVGMFMAEGPLESRLLQEPVSRDQAAATGPVAAIVYDATTAAAVVARSDMLALVPRRIAIAEQQRLGLRLIETEDDGREIDVGLVTHRRAATDAGIAWLRAQLVALAC